MGSRTTVLPSPDVWWATQSSHPCESHSFCCFGSSRACDVFALTLRCCCCHNLLMFHFEGYQRSEKFWSHIDVVSCCMMLCPIVSVIELAWTPVKAELLLCFSIAEPMESHIHCFGSFGCDFTIDDCVCHGIICLDGSGWLLVAHLLQNDSYVHCLSCHDV